MQPTDSPRDPVNQLAPKEPGAPAADDHDRMGPPAPEVIARGYEADVYDAKSVLSVPLLVILFFVLAFGTVTVIFNLIAFPKGGTNPQAHPVAKERNSRPLNDRLAGISRSKEGDQPRLEPLRLRDPKASGKDAKYDLTHAITRPELPAGNSPEIHPEDLRPTRETFPALFQTGPNRLGVDKVLELTDAQLRSLEQFKVQAKPSDPLQSQHYPTASNAGRGRGESRVVVPTAPGAEPKKDEPKKDEPKKPDDKKQPDPAKKPDDKKEQPKPEDKKPDDKKPEEKKK